MQKAADQKYQAELQKFFESKTKNPSDSGD